MGSTPVIGSNKSITYTAQLQELRSFDSLKSLKLETIKDWLKTEPTEDKYWAQRQKKTQEWTWELITNMLKQRYSYPEEAAKVLKLKK